MSGIVWLASYPKSGNTWLRVFIANLRNDTHQAADINDLKIPVASNRRIFDDTTGVEASDLTEEEIARLRPRVYQHLADSSVNTLFLKIHDAYTQVPGGEPLIPTTATAGAIYVIRNPLDVAVSFAHHIQKPLDWVISRMATSDATQTSEPPSRNLSQRLLSWSEHVVSWLDKAPFPVHTVRYEDMHESPLEIFTATARFSGLPCDSERVRLALRHSSFDVLQKQERDHGFTERAASAPSFFREGKAQAWRNVLSRSQVTRILESHETVMRRFGYFPY